MNISDVNLILNTFHSRDWSNNYISYDNSYKRNVWFKIGYIDEFNFVKEIINNDLKLINSNYLVSDWITLLIYKEGDFFGKHCDDDSNKAFSTTGKLNYSNKKILYTGGYVLNDTYTGGDFLLNNKKISTTIGEIFIFGRNEEHEITPVKSGMRYSLHFAVETFIEKILI
jgi:hypothetical protein